MDMHAIDEHGLQTNSVQHGILMRLQCSGDLRLSTPTPKQQLGLIAMKCPALIYAAPLLLTIFNTIMQSSILKSNH